MAVKIKLKRMGKIRAPHYRIVVADSRTKRDGRAIEEIGLYNPKTEPSLIRVDSERAQYWLGVGAQPTEPVLAILKVTGDWQKHKGLPGAEGTLRVAEPKPEKRAAFDAALAEVHGEPKSDATTPKKRPAKKSTPKKDAEAKADAKADEAKAAAPAETVEAPAKAPAEETKAEETKAEETKAEAPKAEKKAEKKAEAKADEAPAEAKADDAPAAEASTDES
ncbi:30S ribosomal protein S16 [Jiangella anatolica]|uniref:Small ribosomal subunit protein bS16 n=1 Tax=Jiangella anatolica TaxID=2670374 RepID=A0A2W2B9Z2_9ACTN|nr:30S ribosomal protein S16 [Jiangella anatolica]PZF84125.1 30S ribosomal protein S16 [Jiangella anatolica]